MLKLYFRLITILSFSLSVTFSHAQELFYQTVRGVVVDHVSQQPIPGATIVLMNQSPLLGTTTDQEGTFKLERVPVGRQALRISSIGYGEKIISNILVGSGKEIVLEISLEESVTQLEEIIIRDKQSPTEAMNEMGLTSARSFTEEETKRFPAAIGDPLRLASSFAGVVGTNDQTNEVVIRGNTPRGIIWKLEGIEIPSPNHFSSEGTASGGVGMFSTQMIARSDFFTGAFAPEYGNATSGVFDIRFRNGNNARHEKTIQAGFLGMDVSAEGPFSKKNKGSYLFNYRYSTLSLLNKLGVKIQDEGENNTFQDLSFKVSMPVRGNGIISVFGLGGSSQAMQNLNQLLDQEDYRMGVVGITHQKSLTEHTFLKTSFATMGTQTIDDWIHHSDQISDTKSFRKGLHRIFIQLNHKFNANNTLEAGLTVSKLNYNFYGRRTNSRNTSPYQDYVIFNDKGSSGTEQVYVSWKFRPSEKITFVHGAHALRFDLTREISFEPRSSFRWQLNSLQSIHVGYGLHSRMESLEYYFGKQVEPDGTLVAYNEDLRLLKSHHFVAGYNRALTPSVHLRTEIYYQHLFHVPVSADPLQGRVFSSLNLSSGYTPIDLVNEGTGKNYGLEISLERKFEKNFYYLTNLSLYESIYSGSDGVERNTRFNGNFAFTLLGGKEFPLRNSKNNVLGINSKFSWAGNKRYIPVDVTASLETGREIRNLDLAFTSQYPHYMRADLQIVYRRNTRRFTSEWRLDIQNVLNRRNVMGDYYSNGRYIFEKGLGFIPVVSYRVEF